MKGNAVSRPATHGGARCGQGSARDGDVLALTVRRRFAVVRHQDLPSAVRRRSGCGDVAAEADQHSTCPRGVARRGCGNVGGERLARGAEVELNSFRKKNASR